MKHRLASLLPPFIVFHPHIVHDPVMILFLFHPKDYIITNHYYS